VVDSYILKMSKQVNPVRFGQPNSSLQKTGRAGWSNKQKRVRLFNSARGLTDWRVSGPAWQLWRFIYQISNCGGSNQKIDTSESLFNFFQNKTILNKHHQPFRSQKRGTNKWYLEFNVQHKYPKHNITQSFNVQRKYPNH